MAMMQNRATVSAPSEPATDPVAEATPLPLRPAAPRRASRRGGQVLALMVLVGGLLVGGIAAVATSPMRSGPAIVATPVAAPGGGAAFGGGAAALGEGGASRGEAAGGGAGGASGAGRASGQGGQGGATRGAAAAAGPRTAGVITAVEGNALVVTGPEGEVRVNLADGASVQRLAPAERSDLGTGQRVIVTGERGADGAVVASGVQIIGDAAAGGPPAGASGRRGAADSAGP